MEGLLNMLLSTDSTSTIDQLNVILGDISTNIYNLSVYMANTQERVFVLLISCVVIGIIAIVSLIMTTIMAHRMNILNKKLNELYSKFNALSK